MPAVPATRPGGVLEIAGSDYHYLVRVLRLRPGAVIPVADAAGRRGRATVTAIYHWSARLLIAAERAETAAGAAATETGTAVQPVAAGMAARAAQPGHARQAAGSGNPATRDASHRCRGGRQLRLMRARRRRCGSRRAR